MQRNVTLKLDDAVIRKARILAVKRDMSMSQWVTGLIVKSVRENPEYARARNQAIKILSTGLHLGGKPLSREQIHER